MSKYIKGMNHVNIRPSHASYDATIELYCDVLGLKMTNFWNKDRNGFNSRNCFIDCGNGTTIEVCESENGTDKAGIVQHFAFDVESAEETLTMLKEKGYPIVTSSGVPTDKMLNDVRVGNPEMHLLLGFIQSPSGEILEFVETLD